MINIKNQTFIENFFKNEKNVGKLTSIVSVIIANLLNYILNVGFNINIQNSTGVSLYLVGNLLGYILDLLFAKKNIYLKDKYGKPKLVDNFNDKIKFILLSFIDKYFIKFIILCIIDTTIGLILLKYVIIILDENKILIDFQYRNLILALIIPSITFFLYVNELRFNWAYEYNENFLLNVLMYIWMTIVLLFAINLNNIETFNNDKHKSFFNKIKNKIKDFFEYK